MQERNQSELMKTVLEWLEFQADGQVQKALSLELGSKKAHLQKVAKNQ